MLLRRAFIGIMVFGQIVLHGCTDDIQPFRVCFFLIIRRFSESKAKATWVLIRKGGGLAYLKVTKSSLIPS